jgi:hypothetical protein
MDITEWLRKEAELVALPRLAEAAAEIERLRAALTEIASQTKWSEIKLDSPPEMVVASATLIGPRW